MFQKYRSEKSLLVTESYICDCAFINEITTIFVSSHFANPENDEGQQSCASSGRLRNDGQRHRYLLGQNRHADHQPDDRRSVVHLREVMQGDAQVFGHSSACRHRYRAGHLRELGVHVPHFGKFFKINQRTLDSCFINHLVLCVNSRQPLPTP